MTAATAMSLSVRAIALRSVVGDARAFLLQLGNARAELAALPDADLAELVRDIEAAQAAVGRVNARGTKLLRRT